MGYFISVILQHNCYEKKLLKPSDHAEAIFETKWFGKRFHRDNVNLSPFDLGGWLLRTAYESRTRLPTTLPTKRQFVEEIVSQEKVAKRCHQEAGN